MHNPTRTRPVGGAAAVKLALLDSKGLRPTERLVLVVIASHANVETGDSFPSVSTIAEHVGVSTRTVQRTLAKLVQLGRLVVRQVATIATRVYRLVVGQPAGPAVSGGDSERQGAANGAVGGDIPSVSPEVSKPKEKNYRAGARDWRRFIPKSKSPNPQQPNGWTPRQGAANPPAPGGDRCQRPGHVGQLAARCIPCRSEALAGGR
ncbi:helix-turn-helix domain-containing protein [Micromonospora chersina]|uniref:helix-turn-helix domain-containing protein n=1 Tax=Micromonospora chersina TaxID=47854 RepID=UPI000B855D4C|nr:helix-turn-helix domain-containing protein [Micromonospora chersina]